MRFLLIFTMLLGGVYAQELSQDAVKAVKSMIVLNGYRCDTIDNTPSFSSWDGSIKVICNNFKYVYEVKDVGGRWTVKVK